MRHNQLHSTLRAAATCVVVALFSLSAFCQNWIDLSKTPVLCNQTHLFKLKKVLPDGYVFYYDTDGAEIVFTRDKDNVNRYSSVLPQTPYVMSCDYVVKKLGETVTVIACLEQYQEENPYYVLFAAKSPEDHSKQWRERLKKGNPCDWIFSVPIDGDFVYEMDIDQLNKMRSQLEQADQSNELVKFNLNQLNMIINSYYEEGDCEAN